MLLWEGQTEPLILPFEDFGDVLRTTPPSPDGQYKIHVFYGKDGTDLYVPRAGRYPVREYYGWEALGRALDPARLTPHVDLSHAQVQTIIGSIGDITGHSVWIPKNDRNSLDWSSADRFEPVPTLPSRFDPVRGVLEAIDVVWLERGSGRLNALFEVEHTTDIYSGLLRSNDVLLSMSKDKPRYNIVANGLRKSAFSAHVGRPTFQASRLSETCGFMDYQSIVEWQGRVRKNS